VSPRVTPGVTSAQPLGRNVLIACCLLVGVQVASPPRVIVMALVLAAVVVAGLVALLGPARWVSRPTRWDSLVLARAVVCLSVVFAAGFVFVTLDEGAPPWVAATGALVFVVFGVACALSSGARESRLWTILLGAWLLISIVAVVGSDSLIDVRYLIEGAARGLLHGHDPYGGSVPNPYSPAMTQRYVAPDFVDGDRILVGYPYGPALLLAEIPGYLIGDARFAHLAALLVLAMVMRKLATDDTGRTLAILAIATPATPKVLDLWWGEPVVMAALGLVVLSLARGWRGRGALSLGFFLLTKQYVVFVLPLLLVVGRRLGLRTLLVGVGLAGIVGLAFLAWDPAAMVHDTVSFQLAQPYREDSTTLVIAWGQEIGRPAAWVMSVLPFVAGLAVSGAVSWRLRPGPTAAAACVGLGFLASVLFSKQAFTNYFLLIEAALVLCCIAWPADPPTPRDADHEALRGLDLGARHRLHQA
jgi:hypothetical protein